jgi:hypothetical protein
MRRGIALALAAGALVLPSQAIAAEAGIETGESTVAVASGSGCRTVDIPKVGRDIFGFVVYKFHQVKRWCWDYPRVTSVSTYTYVSDVDPNMNYGGIVASISRFYTWCCGRGTSGHYSMRQGKFQNCILWFPCTRTEYPWVKIWAHANGSYAWATGI